MGRNLDPPRAKPPKPVFEPVIPTNSHEELGICIANPDGDEHRFVDLGERFGAVRWRCRFCSRTLLELRDGASSERL